MKTLSTELEAHLQQETTTLATCWKLTRRDAVVMGFTEHDRDLEVDGIAYVAASGFTPTAIAANAALAVDNLDVQGLLSADAIAEEDILAGVYDFAEIEIFQVNYTAPNDGGIILRRGWFGEITVNHQQFVAEIRGLAQKLSQELGEYYSITCRAQLGDQRCKVSMAAYTVTGSITSVNSRTIFTDDARTEEAGYFLGGLITFTSGDNEGLSMEIKEFLQGQFVAVLPLPYPVMAGDTYSLKAGCDKNFSTCVGRFNNAINFRGEPHVPGLDRMLETSSTRSEW